MNPRDTVNLDDNQKQQLTQFLLQQIEQMTKSNKQLQFQYLQQHKAFENQQMSNMNQFSSNKKTGSMFQPSHDTDLINSALQNEKFRIFDLMDDNQDDSQNSPLESFENIETEQKDVIQDKSITHQAIFDQLNENYSKQEQRKHQLQKQSQEQEQLINNQNNIIQGLYEDISRLTEMKKVYEDQSGLDQDGDESTEEVQKEEFESNMWKQMDHAQLANELKKIYEVNKNNILNNQNLHEVVNYEGLSQDRDAYDEQFYNQLNQKLQNYEQQIVDNNEFSFMTPSRKLTKEQMAEEDQKQTEIKEENNQIEKKEDSNNFRKRISDLIGF